MGDRVRYPRVRGRFWYMRGRRSPAADKRERSYEGVCPSLVCCAVDPQNANSKQPLVAEEHTEDEQQQQQEEEQQQQQQEEEAAGKRQPQSDAEATLIG